MCDISNLVRSGKGAAGIGKLQQKPAARVQNAFSVFKKVEDLRSSQVFNDIESGNKVKLAAIGDRSPYGGEVYDMAALTRSIHHFRDDLYAFDLVSFAPGPVKETAFTKPNFQNAGVLRKIELSHGPRESINVIGRSPFDPLFVLRVVTIED
jgi:hypothetical protein